MFTHSEYVLFPVNDNRSDDDNDAAIVKANDCGEKPVSAKRQRRMAAHSMSRVQNFIYSGITRKDRAAEAAWQKGAQNKEKKEVGTTASINAMT
jgi:hypothetical protein